MKTIAVAYHTHWDFDERHNSTKYQSYKAMLEVVSQLDYPKYKNIYGSDYYFKYFFSDSDWLLAARYGVLGSDFLTMLEVLREEDNFIETVFVFDTFGMFRHEKLKILARVCRDLNIELIFPYELKDNIAHKELFDEIADAV